MSYERRFQDREDARDSNHAAVSVAGSPRDSRPQDIPDEGRRPSGSPPFGEEARIASYYDSKNRNKSDGQGGFTRYPSRGGQQNGPRSQNSQSKRERYRRNFLEKSHYPGTQAARDQRRASIDERTASNKPSQSALEEVQKGEKTTLENHRTTNIKAEKFPTNMKSEKTPIKTEDNGSGTSEQQSDQNTPEKPDPSIDTSVLSSVTGSVPDSFYKTLVRGEEDEHAEYTDDSEAETLAAHSPPRINRGRRLVRQSDIKEDVEDSDEEEPQQAQKPQASFSKLKLPEMTLRPYKLKRDSSGCSLLQRACKKGNVKDVIQLLERGADPNEADFCGFTCLHEAALAGHTEVAKILLDHGADVNKPAFEAGDLETPLIDASENQHTETVKLLLKYGADTRVYNIDGFTALTKIYNDHANEEGYDEIIKLLEEANHKIAGESNTTADPLLDIMPPSPDSVVEDPNDSYFGELLRKKSAYMFRHAAEGHKELIANYLLEGGDLLSQPDIFIVAARNGHLEMINIIMGLATDFDIDTENSCGLTALLASVGRGHRDVVSFLLAEGANPFRKRNDSLDALEIARRSANFDPVEVRSIQEAMAKRQNARNQDGKNERKPEEKEKATVKAKDTAEKDHKEQPSHNDSRSHEHHKENIHKPQEEPRKRKSDEEVPEAKRRTRKESIVSETETQDHDANALRHSTSHELASQDYNSPSLHRTNTNDSRESTPNQPQSPVNKLTEEQRVRSAEEARIWQEKVEAKKRARREMFLKMEREKEKKRKEEEERRLEEEKRQEKERLEREKEIKRKREQEELEKSKALEDEMQKLRRKIIIENYPEGLLRLRTDLSVAERVRDYSPLYLVEKDSVDYVTDIQLFLLTGEPVTNITAELPEQVEATVEEKGALWEIMCELIGDRNEDNGAEKFKNLLVHFVKLDPAKAWCESRYPKVYEEVWVHRRVAKVDLESFKKITRGTLETVVADDLQPQYPEGVFIPPSLKRRQDAIRAIQTAANPLW